MMHRGVFLLALTFSLSCSMTDHDPARAAGDAEALVAEARVAASAGEFDRALELAAKAIEANPKFALAYRLRGSIYATKRQHQEAQADFTRLIGLEPKNALHYDLRGSELFCLGMIKEAIADFDKAIELDSRLEEQHWKRGIAYYYAGEYGKGQKQFEAYQTIDDNDVENAVWRYLCMCGTVGPQKAAGEILKIKNDMRVPMMQVYDLYRGAAKPEDVLAAAKAGPRPRADVHESLFYAHLYVGLYYDASGDKDKALEHLAQADKLVISHYMWDVAHVHVERLRKEGTNQNKQQP
jgi:lipoprotein NlpI